jgi:hypothetical protein
MPTHNIGIIMKYKYPAVRVNQTGGSPSVILFAAPSIDMKEWAGIPQKRKIDNGDSGESVGFQREESSKRINEIKKFFGDPKNVIQNPILCASRKSAGNGIAFVPFDDQSESPAIFGNIEISPPKFKEMAFSAVLSEVRAYIEARVPELQGREPSPELVERLKRIAVEAGHLDVEEDVQSDDEENDADIDAESQEASDQKQSDMTAALFEETHISDFWEEIAARHEISKSIDEAKVGDKFLGFSKDALASYILPVIVVDGQHRLRGAIEHAKSLVNDPKYRESIEAAIAEGKKPEEVSDGLLRELSRTLPISLLMSDAPAEQVFQFVVVNQKATPIGKALLGTIVSTTLSQKELEGVADRLKNAGIELEESRAISFLAKFPESPFFGKVQRGIDSDAKELLEWNVLGHLVAIFRNLSGGRLFGEKNDYADRWRKKQFLESAIVADAKDNGYEDAFKYWSSTDGPWRLVFMEFWKAVRDKLADTTDAEARNYWGSPRISNLFNKISLTILAADFFMFMCESKRTLDSASQVSELVDDWLEDVQPKYFARDWNLSGVKKDSPGIKKQWAALWREYRKDPSRVPRIENYRNSKAD